jgi:hypothetical protein
MQRDLLQLCSTNRQTWKYGEKKKDVNRDGFLIHAKRMAVVMFNHQLKDIENI